MESQQKPIKPSLFSRLANLIRALFWLFLIFMFGSQWIGSASLEKKRAHAIENLQNQRGSRIITLIHRQETISLLGVPVTKYIDIDDAEAVLRAIRLTPPDRPIDMILHTPPSNATSSGVGNIVVRSWPTGGASAIRFNGADR